MGACGTFSAGIGVYAHLIASSSRPAQLNEHSQFSRQPSFDDGVKSFPLFVFLTLAIDKDVDVAYFLFPDFSRFSDDELYYFRLGV
ncbi:MAG: hypothetical protein JRJ37_00395 [Deltaproteobacteria bacterium]|nr:hypothetical protein [Deltaproteobacteria bacterium]